MNKAIIIVMMAFCALILQGCVVAVVGAGAGVTKVASDPRSTGTQVDDTTLNSRVSTRLKNEPELKGYRIIATAYNGNILLTGQAANQSIISKAVSIVQDVEGVNKVYNQIRIADKVSAGTMSNDAWITTKVKSNLIANKQTKARDIKVITENSEVFLIGIVTYEEGQLAAQVASKVSGVTVVNTIFTYTD
ncbi:division/outer membrane stress-associated lipid-binding lipoprotein [Orbaceae bacterium ac157xtp]